MIPHSDHTLPETGRLKEIVGASPMISRPSVSLSLTSSMVNSSAGTMRALLHFTDTLAIFVRHGWKGDVGSPPRFPRIVARWVINKRKDGGRG